MRAHLGIDVGTSGVKALVVDPHGRTAADATAPLTLATPRPGWAEQDPEDWWRAAVKAVRAALRRARVKRGDVASIGLSGQMHSSVFLDARNKVIRPALLWCDGRTTRQCQAITQAVGADNLRRWACNPALEGFTLPKILWLREHEPAAWRRLAKVILPKDFIRLRLTGVLATDPSDASATLMYETAGLKWSADILKAVGLSQAIVPDVVGSSETSGKVGATAARALGIAEGVVVAGGGADNACGAIGVGAVAPGEAVSSWGTSGTVLAPTTQPIVDPGLRAHTFCHAVPETWYVMGVMLTAGGAFAWFRDLVARGAREKEATRLLNEEAAKIPIGAEGLTFLPYLQGERTPHRDASARGAFVGLSLAHGRGHMSRAVLEGVTFGLRDSVAIVRDMNLPLACILVTGGGAKSPFLRKLQADVFGVPVARVNREEGPALGAALLGAVAAGAFKDVAVACKSTLKRLPQQKPNAKAHAAYQVPYQRFRDLYPALKGRF
jgi:xylulokinase